MKLTEIKYESGINSILEASLEFSKLNLDRYVPDP